MLELLAAAGFLAAMGFFAAGTRAAVKGSKACLDPMVNQIQTSHHRPQPGDFVNKSTAVQALQSFLASKGIPTGPVDGVLGHRTVTGLQQYLQGTGYRVVIDGWCGRQTIGALQTWLHDQGQS